MRGILDLSDVINFQCMPEDPLALLVIVWAGVIATVSLYYINNLLGKIGEVEFKE